MRERADLLQEDYVIKASAKSKSGGHLCLIGLSTGNLRLLQQGRPIAFELREAGIDLDVEILIMWGETEEAIVAELRAGGLKISE